MKYTRNWYPDLDYPANFFMRKLNYHKTDMLLNEVIVVYIIFLEFSLF